MPTVPSIDAKPLYALAGAGEAAVSALRARVNNLPDSVKSIQTNAQQNFQTQVKALPTLVQGLPTQIADLRVQVRKQVIDLASKAEAAYDDFAAQGEKVVAARRGTVTTSKPASKPAAAKKPAAKPAAKKPAAPTAADVPTQSETSTTEPGPSNLNGSTQAG